MEQEKLEKEAKLICKKLEVIYKEVFKKDNVLSEDKFIFSDKYFISKDSFGNGLIVEALFNITNKKDMSKFSSKVNKMFKTIKSKFTIYHCGDNYLPYEKVKTKILTRDEEGNEKSVDYEDDCKRAAPSIIFRVMDKCDYLIKSPFVFSNGLFDGSHMVDKSHHEKFLNANGFAKTESWNLSSTIARFILPRLIYLKESYHGLFLDDPSNRNSRVLLEEETDKIFDKMIYAFEHIALKMNLDYSVMDEKDKKEIQEGLNLFAKYFLELWD